MRLLSFDIGICNLAYAYADYNVETKRLEIVDWSLLPLREAKEKKDFGEITSELVRVINEKFWDLDIDVVLIENQPVMKNPVMKTLQIMIYTVFMLKKQQKSLNTDVKLVSAQTKLKVKEKVDVSHIVTTDKYRRNKQLAIAYTRYYLKHTHQAEKWQILFDKCPKLDDMADSVLYIFNYVESFQQR
jgi:hypothetical protein